MPAKADVPSLVRQAPPRPKRSLASWLGNGRYEVATGHLMAHAGGLSTIDSYMVR